MVGPEGQVIGAVSGGVDSSVAAVLLQKAIGDRFHAVLVDNGLLRKNEAVDVVKRLKVKGVFAWEGFLMFVHLLLLLLLLQWYNQRWFRGHLNCKGKSLGYRTTAATRATCIEKR